MEQKLKMKLTSVFQHGLQPLNSRLSVKRSDQEQLQENLPEVNIISSTQSTTQHISSATQAFKEALQSRLTKAFRIKIPYFPKRPFGKHDNMNDSQLNFIEMNIKDNTQHLLEKNSKFFKLACGRASSVGRRRRKSNTTFRAQLLRLV